MAGKVMSESWIEQRRPGVGRLDYFLGKVAIGVAMGFAATGITVTHREHVRTETVIDRNTGLARAAVGLRFFSE